jgi:dihydroorotase
MPGVQTILPLMLNHMSEGKLSLQRLVELTSYNAHKLFGFAAKGEVKVGNDADLTFVDLNKTQTVNEDWLESKCGWSPFTGDEIKGWPVGTMVRGKRVMWEAELVTPSTGRPIDFNL